MAVRAVIFDYGEVLSRPADPEAHLSMLEISGLPHDEFEKHYWKHRADTDAARLDGQAYWEAIARNSGRQFSPEQIRRLRETDGRMWTKVNTAMVAWVEELKRAKFKLAILSNMGEDVHAQMQREFPWLSLFEQLTWSYELGLLKPDPEIYLHTIDKLGVIAGEALFIDNLKENVEGARAVGLHAILFEDVGQLARELQAQHLSPPLPLPISLHDYAPSA